MVTGTRHHSSLWLPQALDNRGSGVDKRAGRTCTGTNAYGRSTACEARCRGRVVKQVLAADVLDGWRQSAAPFTFAHEGKPANALPT